MRSITERLSFRIDTDRSVFCKYHSVLLEKGKGKTGKHTKARNERDNEEHREAGFNNCLEDERGRTW